MLSISVLGASGRVGRHVVAHALQDPSFQLCAAFVGNDSAHIGTDAGTMAGEAPCGILLEPIRTCAADVVVDFSLPEGLRQWLSLEQDTALVTGTTGNPASTDALLETHSLRAPVVAASNFSEGVALMRALVAAAARHLPHWDAEIIETHHRAKRDAPSGTAQTLIQDLLTARKGAHVTHGRVGAVGPRDATEIGVHSVRAGSIHGIHDVVFAGLNEELSIKHTATSRDVFAHGALNAARWITAQPPGRYDMPDVLGL